MPLSARVLLLLSLCMLTFPRRAEAVGLDQLEGPHEVPIVAPPYHGLEPKLRLVYRVGGGQSQLGVGWSLAGLSFLERAKPGRGAPRYDSNDIWLLDGRELVPCSAVTSREQSTSCATAVGGTHTTKVESFSKITGDAAGFTVQQPNGNVATYSTTLTSTAGVFRYYLTQLSDPHGNVVSYSYAQDGSDDLYLAKIGYGGSSGATIVFDREVRPDAYTVGRGDATLVTTRYRYSAIEIRGVATAAAARVYAIGYQTSTLTGRSLLTSITPYGSGATVSCTSTACTVSGSSLPPTSYAYVGQTGASGRFRGETWNTTSGTWGLNERTYKGDFDGDGRTDVATVSGTSIFVKRSTGTTFVDQTWSTAATAWSEPGYSWVADFNGDGKDDLATAIGTTIYVYRSNGTSFVKETWSTGGSPVGDGDHTWIGDYNGDGKMDIATSTVGGYMRVKLSSGSSFTESTWSTTYDGGKAYVGDFDGDGKDDLVTGTGTAHVLRSTGTSFVEESWGSFSVSATWNVAGDFNGDGLTDLASLGASGITVRVSTGTTFLTQLWFVGTVSHAADWNWMFDADTDGRQDLVVRTVDPVTKLPSTLMTYRSTGTAFVQQASTDTATFHTLTTTLSGDFDGDGRSELLAFTSGGSITVDHNVLDASGALKGTVDLLATITNSLGGATTFAYLPSSAYLNLNNPPITPTVQRVTRDDGRGTTSLTSYTYDGGYYDTKERRFIGYTTVKQLDPMTAADTSSPQTVVTFSVTGLDGAARPIEVRRYDGLGRWVGQSLTTYVSNTTIPYRTLDVQTSALIGDGVGGWQTSTEQRTYDCYDAVAQRWIASACFGNQTSLTRIGGSDVAGKKTTTSTSFRPAAAAFIVSRPAAISVTDGAGALVSQKLYTYDTNGTWDAPPTKGDLTVESTWVDRIWSGGVLVSANAYLQSKYTHDARGNVTVVVAPDGATTTTVYDATYGLYPISVVRKLSSTTNAVTTTTWDYARGLKTAEAAGGLTSKVTYDAFGREARWDLVDGSGVSRGYRITSHVDEGKPALQYEQLDTPGSGAATVYARRYLDGFGRTYRAKKNGATAGADVCVDTSFDVRGNRAKDSLPYPCTGSAAKFVTYAFDGLNRPTKLTSADGSATTTSYGVGVVTTIDPLGHKTSTTSDSLGHLVKRTEYDAAGVAISSSYAYDTLGRETVAIDPKGNAIAKVLDSLGRVLSEQHPDHGERHGEFDAGGNLVASTHVGLNERTTFTFDLAHRTLSRTSRANTTPLLTTFKYDEARTGFFNQGHLTSFSDPAGTASLDYDAAGNVARKTRVVDAVTYTQSWAYDLASRLLYTTFPDGDTVGTAAAPITYDAAGRLATVPGTLTGIAYDAADHPVTVSYANGVTTSNTYDAARGWLLSAVVKKGTSPELGHMSYVYDLDGKLTSKASANWDESWTYTHDALHRLTSAHDVINSNVETYAYDSIGNITSGSRLGSYGYTSAFPHAVTAAGSASYTYDAAGRMTNNGKATMSWTGDGQLASLGPDTYTYDAVGVRIKQRSGLLSTFYFSDDYEQRHGQVTKYITVAGMRLARRTSGVTSYLHPDRQASIWLVSDANGLLESRYAYRPYGDFVSTTFDGPGYTGERRDASGLMYLNARYFDPLLARFISPDPTVPGARIVGLNAYAYAGNDPVLSTDRNGYGPGDGLDGLIPQWGPSDLVAYQFGPQPEPTFNHGVGLEVGGGGAIFDKGFHLSLGGWTDGTTGQFYVTVAVPASPLNFDRSVHANALFLTSQGDIDVSGGFDQAGVGLPTPIPGLGVNGSYAYGGGTNVYSAGVSGGWDYGVTTQTSMTWAVRFFVVGQYLVFIPTISKPSAPPPVTPWRGPPSPQRRHDGENYGGWHPSSTTGFGGYSGGDNWYGSFYSWGPGGGSSVSVGPVSYDNRIASDPWRP